MKKSRTPRLIAGGLAIAGAFALLIGSSMKSNTLRAVPVHELRQADATSGSFVGQRLRVVGFVGRAPVRKAPLQTAQGMVNINHFAVTDKGATLAVEYRDALPDTFRAGGPVQVDGVYARPGVIRADHVLTKCPSKYDAAAAEANAKAGQQTAITG